MPYLSIGKDEIDTSVYSYKEYLGIFVIIISTVLIMISLTSIISVMAKSIKEASSSMAPLTILTALIGISGMYSQNNIIGEYQYVIPLYNSAQCLNEIFLFKCNACHIIISVIFNMVCTVIFVFILAKLFRNEKMIL